MKLTKTILSRIWRLGRGTATVMGLAVLLALTVRLATAALGAVPGDPFKLGRLNAVNGVTQLVGKSAGTMLRVDNNSSAKNSRVMSLEVQPGKAPLSVNASAGKATNLDADKLDGKDSTSFFSGKTYQAQSPVNNGTGGGSLVISRALCDQGDRVLGGGASAGNIAEDDLVQSIPINAPSGWQAIVRDNGNGQTISASALCADFPPLRP